MTPTQVILVSVLVFLVLYFLLRPIMLWYWKVDKIEKQLVEQTRILKIVYQQELRAERDKEKDITDVVFSFPDDITLTEKVKIKEKAKELKSGQLITLHVRSRGLQFWKSKREFQSDIDNPRNNVIVATKLEL